jgi:hypothetical protein
MIAVSPENGTMLQTVFENLLTDFAIHFLLPS